jgi:hypothetical protein
MNGGEYIRPPGTYYDNLAHPRRADEAVEIAVIQEHRFAFFYWLKWKNELGGDVPPNLISLDWHADLAAPSKSECDELKALDTNDYKSASIFCWEKLNSGNDGHILSAAYLGLIGDIYVVCKQEHTTLRKLNDLNGNTHEIHCYNSVDNLLGELKSDSNANVFLDIDLDYFTESQDPCGGGEHLKLVGDDDIRGILNPESELFAWMLERLSGMTIATEPKCCGGFINSNHLFSVVSSALFHPPLLSHKAGWKHRAT